MMRKLAANSTSQAIPIFVQDSTSTSGAGLGSLVFNTSGLAAKYRRQGDSTWTTITLATATVGTWATGGFVADGGPVTGGYELGLPNAVLASSAGVTWAEVAVYGATNMLPVLIFIEIDAVNYQDAVHFGLSALPNTAVSTNASLLTGGTGTDQISVSAGKTLLQATQTGVTIPTVTTVTNQLTAAQVATGLWQDATAGDFTVASSIGKSLYTSGVAPGAANGLFIAGTNAATTVTTAFTTTFTGNLTGSVGSVTGAVGSVTGNVGGNVTGNVTGSVGSVVANVGGSVASVAGNVGGSVTGSVGSVTGSVGSVTGNVGGNVVGSVANVLAINSVSTSSVTTIGANLGTTQPVNFTGTAGSALVKSDTRDFLGQAVVLDSNNYPGVNIVDVAGSAASTAGRVSINGVFPINTAAGFSFRMVQSGDNKTAYTSPVSLAGSRTIAGGTSAAVSGTITQIGSTNEYYFGGLAADFNGAEVHFAFTATGANPVYYTVMTTP